MQSICGEWRQDHDTYFNHIPWRDGTGNELYADKIKDVSEDNQYLILCDIKGGSPFNVVSRYSFKNDDVAVIYGMNLPILIEAIVQCGNEGLKLKELAGYLQQQAGSTIGLSEL